MKIQASNPEHRARYEVYLDGVNVSGLAKEADDVANVISVVLRDQRGQVVRRSDQTVLTAVLQGHVTIVSKINEPALVRVQ